VTATELEVATPRTLARRLLPLQVGIGVQGLMLWVPIEKLFQTQIGFDAASIGVMAAAYAAVVPLLEVPSGILADRWSRSGILVVSSAALAASSLLGGLSTNVLTYVVAAMILGVYFAMNSGTSTASSTTLSSRRPGPATRTRSGSAGFGWSRAPRSRAARWPAGCSPA
jgi:MFS family permease